MNTKKKVPYSANQGSYLASAVNRACAPLALLLAAIFVGTSCTVGTGSGRERFDNQPSEPSSPNSQRHLQEWNPVKVGVADYVSSFLLEEEIQAKYDIEVQFQDVKLADYNAMVKPLLDNGKEVVVVLELYSAEYLSLVEVINGDFDPYILAFIEDWKNDGNRELQIRPLHEMNGDWYSWGTFRGGTNTPKNYIQAFRHVHNVFTEAGANFKMQLCYNCESANQDEAPFIQWWPGEEYVDIILCDGYNRFGTSPDHTEWKSFKEVFGIGHDRMALLPGNKPLGAGETSTVSKGGDKVKWIQNAFESLRDDFPRVTEVDFFFINKEGPGEGDWALNSKEELLGFGKMINEMKGIVPGQGLAPVVIPPASTSSASNDGNDETMTSTVSDDSDNGESTTSSVSVDGSSATTESLVSDDSDNQ